ncbi:OLC1v1008987C1 [Oldenlandia corymbosa var. corymbosa]|uniref:OLC1v1008987C1 n=1 Tax=Oldenlandia corymbosa var. corymbosa TaxID=529605 RepID=A0AAV1DMU9_OLDCO|nr:OLC1v1008987C1 [Oldenlandia corymbosa var. corymbosa]
MGEVMLGMPGPWADDNYDVADHYTTKIGGAPDWPIPDLVISADLLVCGGCKSKLCLLAQVYAPISTKNLNIEERVLYVFGCSKPQCGNNTSSWRVLRVQKPTSSEEPVQPCLDVPPLASPSHTAPKNGWQEKFFTFDAGEDADGGNYDDLDMEDLSRAFAEAASLSSSSKKQNFDPLSPLKLPASGQKCKLHDNKFAVIPCFYIYAQEEKFSKNTKALNSKCQSLPSHQGELELDDRSREEAWEGEIYEHDKALYADRTYLKFKKRIDANPEQCLRYSYGGRPLMASLKMGDPGTCSLCGGRRHYEMQLMPPLLYFLQEAASGEQKNSLENWNWLTLIIYTCSKSCTGSFHEDNTGSQGWSVAEEAAIVQFE